MNDKLVPTAVTQEPEAESTSHEIPRCVLRQSHMGSCIGPIIEELNSTLELDAVLHKVAEGVKSFVDYDGFAVLLLDELGQELRFRYGMGYPQGIMENWRFGLGQGLVGSALEAGRPLRVDDVRADGRYICALDGIRSELAVPLMIEGRPIGVMDLCSNQTAHFAECHQRSLSILAGPLANAIENSRLYGSVREQTRTLSLLHELSGELTSILDREQLLQRVAELVKRIIDYQVFTVMLWNPRSELLENAFSQRYDQRMSLKDGFPLGHGVTGTAAALRRPVRVPNVRLDARYVECGHGIRVRSELAVPLVFQDRLIGVLDLESTEYNAFSEQHEQMLSTLASSIAIALENARLYTQLQEEECRLERDLNTARVVQGGLLPDSAPAVSGLETAFGYRSARQLGGDFYDFLPYGDGRLALAIGDVAGKGTAAALYGSLAVGILRGRVVQQAREPAEMLPLLNRELRRCKLPQLFLALAFAVYDPRDRSLSLASAGFPWPWLLHDGSARPIPAEGPALGIMPRASYKQKRLTLRDGDAMVFCSDGFEEAMNPRGEQFGRRRLRALLGRLARAPASEIVDGLMRATDEHAEGHAEAHDDRTVVVIKLGSG